MANKNFKDLLSDVRKQKDHQNLDIKKLIRIDSMFRDLIPPLSEEEFALLAQNILAEGCRESILLWEKNENEYVLIDGHNRYAICQKHGLDFKFSVLKFRDEQEAILFMINNQLGRRNLSIEQASYLRGKRYESQKKTHGGVRKASGKSYHLLENENLLPSDFSSGKSYHLLENENSLPSNFSSGQNVHLLENENLLPSDFSSGQNVHLLENENSLPSDFSSGQNVHLLENENLLPSDFSSGQNVHLKTSEKLSNQEGFSEKTIRRDAQFAKGIDLIGKENPELKKDILSGKVKINKNQIQALAKLESFPKIESLDQIADILQADKPAKKQVKTDLEIAKEKITKILKEMNLSAEQKQNLREFLAKESLL